MSWNEVQQPDEFDLSQVPKPQNPKPLTLNPKPSTLKPKP